MPRALAQCEFDGADGGHVEGEGKAGGGPEAEARHGDDHRADIYGPGRNEPQQILRVADDGVVPAVQIHQDERSAGDGGKRAGERGEKRPALRAEVSRDADHRPAEQKVQHIPQAISHRRIRLPVLRAERGAYHEIQYDHFYGVRHDRQSEIASSPQEPAPDHSIPDCDPVEVAEGCH